MSVHANRDVNQMSDPAGRREEYPDSSGHTSLALTSGFQVQRDTSDSAEGSQAQQSAHCCMRAPAAAAEESVWRIVRQDG